MISIVIPLYNKEKQIQKTLESVFAQTYTDYEIVIVNDGSTDKSVEVVESIMDPRIRLVHQENAGVSAARNRGIEESRGEYIALLDADDLWKPEYLETIVNLIARYPDCHVFATNYSHLDSNGNSFPTILNRLPFKGENGILSNYFEVASVSSPPICSICIVATKSAFLSVGGFPLGIKSGEDLLTWARLASLYKIAYCKKPLAIFQIESYSIREMPKRTPPDLDMVGEELRNLKQQFHSPHIAKYIANWHKMRCAVYYRLGKRRKSIKEALKGLKYNPFNFKLNIYIILNILNIQLSK